MSELPEAGFCSAALPGAESLGLLESLALGLAYLDERRGLCWQTPLFAHLYEACGRPDGVDLLARLAQPQTAGTWIWASPAGSWELRCRPANASGAQLLSCRRLDEAESAQLRNQQIHGWVLETMDQSLVITDPHLPDNPIVFASRRFLEQTGYAPEEVLQRNCRFLQGPDTDPATLEAMRQALRAHRSFEGEILNYRKDGSRFWNLLTISPIFAASGELSCFVGLQTDITPLKAAADHEHRLNQELMRQNQDLAQFAYIVSHHVRAPLANILGICQVAPQADAQTQPQLLQGLTQASLQLDQVIRDLNEVLSLREARHAAGEPLPCPELLQRVQAELSAQLEAAGASLEADLDCRGQLLPSVPVSDILRQLLENALRFRDPERALLIRVSSAIEAQELVLEVGDNGLGIDLERYGDQLFGLYKRFHPQLPGRGRGLYLARVQAHTFGGRLEAESRPGVGSRFRLRLPLPQAGA